MGVDLQHRLVKLRDFPVDEGLQRLLQPVVVPLKLPLVLLLVGTNQALVFAEGILTSETESVESEGEGGGGKHDIFFKLN